MIAILSNVNVDSIIRKVNKTVPVLSSNGYGNVLGDITNKASSYNEADVDATYIITDIRELVCSGDDYATVIDEYLGTVISVAQNNPGEAFCITDADYYLPVSVDYSCDDIASRACDYWNDMLAEACAKCSNVLRIELAGLVRRIGESNFYSQKMWYLGSIRYSNDGINALVDTIIAMEQTRTSVAKKVLVLDMDNTIWGGVVGELGANGIELGASHLGKVYQELQDVLLMMNRAGTVLAINSKNNESDVWEVFDNNPQMRLHRENISAYRINWNPKSANMYELAVELNVGLDSIVFLDDNPVEREEVMNACEGVVCPEWPEEPEKILEFIIGVNNRYFKKTKLTAEDKKKREQYAAKAAVEQFKASTADYAEFLKGLMIQVKRVDAAENRDRFYQLFQKTNQFNTTCNRYTSAEIDKFLADDSTATYIYEVSDRFANHGLCVAAVVKNMGEEAVIDDFVMSCRVMGRDIEYTVLEEIAQDMRKSGVTKLYASWQQDKKNAPVEGLYDKAKYELVDEQVTDGVRIKNYLLRL